MNNNASMTDRACAIFLDLITFIGYVCGVCMLIFSVNEINTEVNSVKISQNQLIRLIIVLIVVYFALDVLLTRLFATTPGKLFMNCDVDFHMGNSMIHNIIRSFFKVICLFTIIPGIISYVYASGNPENQTYHDVLAKSNVTSTTRMPRFLGVLVVLGGIALLVLFIVNYREAIGLNFQIGLKSFKIFEF